MCLKNLLGDDKNRNKCQRAQQVLKRSSCVCLCLCCYSIICLTEWHPYLSPQHLLVPQKAFSGWGGESLRGGYTRLDPDLTQGPGVKKGRDQFKARQQVTKVYQIGCAGWAFWYAELSYHLKSKSWEGRKEVMESIYLDLESESLSWITECWGRKDNKCKASNTGCCVRVKAKLPQERGPEHSSWK